MITGTGMEEWRNVWNANWYVCECGMLEFWNSGVCTELGNLYIFTVVVVMSDDCN